MPHTHNHPVTREVLAAAFEHAGEGLVLVTVGDTGDPARIQIANPTFALLTGYRTEDAVSRPPDWLERLLPDGASLARIRNALGQEQPFVGEVSLRRRDGSEIPVEAVISPIHDEEGKVTHWLAALRDLRDRRCLEHQLWQSQKVSVVAELARGVAASLDEIAERSELLSLLARRVLPADDPIVDDALSVDRAAREAVALMQLLSSYSQPQPLALTEVDLNEVIGAMTPLLTRMLGPGIRLAVNLASDLGTVRAYPGQIRQIVVNLVVNARDAMPGGGTLTIATSNTYPESMLPGSYIGRGMGAQVLLSVMDTGVGMSAETKARLFEPFFTTKGGGTAQGLGLTTVHGIVKQCGGYVWVQSAEGQGTTTRVYLPCSQRAARP